jgi:hypothetical protein
MAAKIQIRRGTAAQWTAANPVLIVGELGFETDTKLIKAGDGTTAWTALAYYTGAAPDALNLTGTTLAPTIVSSSLTTVGTLTGLTVSNTITGNINTASQLQNPRTISLGGEATGNTSFDGSANVTITTTIPLLDGGNY